MSFTFGAAIELLREGKPVARKAWNGEKFIVKQVPCSLGMEIIPSIVSLPEQAKKYVLSYGKITYRNQLLKYDMTTGEADSWGPTTEDIFADDWFELNGEESEKK